MICVCLSNAPLTKRSSIGDAEETLLKSALIDKSGDTGVISIHRLIQAAVIRNQTADDRQKFFDAAVNILSWGFPDTWSEDVGHQFQAWAKCEKCLPHVHYLVDQHERYKIKSSGPQRYAELLLRCSWLVFHCTQAEYF
jgi:hypothetical protein